MSETYDFVSLSETEEMAELGEGTMALVLDGGAVKRVSAGQFGGGGVGSYVVNVSTTDGATWTADKTHSEILAAIGEGAAPVALIDLTALVGATTMFYIPMVAVNTDDSVGVTLLFMQMMSAEEVNGVYILPDNSVMVELSFLGGE